MKLFVAYIKEHLTVILMFLLFCSLFFAAFALYHLPVMAVIYPALLCLAAALAFVAADFIRYRRRHIILNELTKLPENLYDTLSTFDTQSDSDYREIIRLLSEQQYRLRTENDSKISDMIEYYTTWVHQIKTPIASMKLTLQNEDTAVSRRLSEDLFRIEQYVEMVLCYLRLDSDYTDYVFKEYDLDTIVKQAVRKFAGQFIGSNIKLNYTPLKINAVTDEKWVSFIIEQVISNALKYTTSGSIAIYAEAPDTLCIKDTGIGIAPEDLPRIFDKGYTGYNGRRDKKASGIGLYLCRRICNNLGHEISAESKLGEGTVIRIRFEQKNGRVE